jgi:hypothetical protein
MSDSLEVGVGVPLLLCIRTCVHIRWAYLHMCRSILGVWGQGGGVSLLLCVHTCVYIGWAYVQIHIGCLGARVCLKTYRRILFQIKCYTKTFDRIPCNNTLQCFYDRSGPGYTSEEH